MSEKKITKKYYQSLKKKIQLFSQQYYTYDSPTIPDHEFDELYRELKLIEEKNPNFIESDSPTQLIGSKVKGGFKKVKHSKPMMSLNNAANIEEFKSFYNKIIIEVPKPVIMFAEPKFDGLAISLTYEKGNLVSAVTRGDGNEGEDVTSNIRTIQKLPLKLLARQVPNKLIVAAEVYSLISDFQRINDNLKKSQTKTFANPRNFAAGTVRQQDPIIAFKRNLQIFIHGIIEIDQNLSLPTHSESMLYLSKIGFQTCDLNKKINDINQAIDYFDKISNKRDKLPYEIDGIVYKVDNYELREQIGYTSKAPKWSIAFKFPSQVSQTKIVDVTFQVGRTGVITPVAELKPVNIGGVTVSRATLHNLDDIRKKDIRKNDYVYVKRAGDVIPEVEKVNLSKRDKTTKISIPKVCPACGEVIIKISNQSIYKCPNELTCRPQIIQSIDHFASRKAMNITGLGDSIIISLVDSNLINDYSDLYYLSYDSLILLDRMAKVSVNNLIASIDKSKKPNFDKFIYSLGIREVGLSTARILSQNFRTMDELISAKRESLESIKDIGPIVADNITSFFSVSSNIEKIKKLVSSGIEIIYPKLSSNEFISSKSFVVTGSFNKISRNEIEEIILSNGGKVSSSVSGKTEYLICGDQPGSKLNKAKKIGTTILTEEKFLKLL
tara:strand:+ start:2834 stop:4831 length:1998 start_codon:yes stop_codon:yes gene_type:complete